MTFGTQTNSEGSIQLSLVHGPVPVLLYPHHDLGDPTSIPKDTSFPCTVNVSSTVGRTKIGGLIAVWQTSIRRSEWPPKEDEIEGRGKSIGKSGGDDDDWNIYKTIVVTIRDGDFWVNEDEPQSYIFEFTLPAKLRLSRTTPWERIAHVLHVFAFAPSPTYSVIPPLRGDDDAVPLIERKASDAASIHSIQSRHSATSSLGSNNRRRSSLLENLRRISIGSNKPRGSLDSGRASIVSIGSDTSKNDKKRGSIAMPIWDEPPFPALEEPFIAETHKEIIVTATPDERGQVRPLGISKDLDIDGFGRVVLHANSDMFTIGSGIIVCAWISELNPLATFHCFRVSLIQRIFSADGSTVHYDKYVLYEQGRPYGFVGTFRPPEKDIIWRGSQARIIDQVDLKNGKLKGKSSHYTSSLPESNSIHITCVPRVPSSAVGGRPSWPIPDPELSTNDHELEFSFYWSIYGRDEVGKPLQDQNQEGTMRWTNFRVKPVLGSCSFSHANVTTPKYSMTSTESVVDIEKCMEAFKPNTEPRSFKSKPQSWVEKNGKRIRLKNSNKNYDDKSFDVRQHQFDTDGVCACFYPEGYEIMEDDYRKNYQPKVIDGELDLALAKPVRLGDETMDVVFDREKAKNWSAWWERHKGERRAVPGFINCLFTECPCEPFRKRNKKQSTTTEEVEENLKATAG